TMPDAAADRRDEHDLHEHEDAEVRPGVIVEERESDEDRQPPVDNQGDDTPAGPRDGAATLIRESEALPRVAARSHVSETGGLGILAWHPLSLPARGTRNMLETLATPQGNPLPIPSESGPQVRSV